MPTEDLGLTPNATHMPKTTAQGDINALRGLLSLVNDPRLTGAVVPKGANPAADLQDLNAAMLAARAKSKGIAPAPVDTPDQQQTQEPQQQDMTLKQFVGSAVKGLKELVSPAPQSEAITPENEAPARSRPTRFFFTGRLGSGKDFVAAAIGAKIFGFADPMYQIASELTGFEVTATKGKDIPGMRDFLQRLGQWGRGDVDEKYPITPERVLFVEMIRQRFNMPTYGLDRDIWVKHLLDRAAADDTGSRKAVTNCRFKNEYDQLSQAGWTHFHIMCSTTTWTRRLVDKHLTPQSPEINDKSERMAANLDAQVGKIISAKVPGGKLSVIWNDETIPSPSPRLWTLSEFVREHSL